MTVTQTIADCRAERSRLGKVALVPTMGALHAGHLSLIAEAKKHAPKVAVSIFVNPTQFGPKEDFNKYPRPIESDLQKCQHAGVDLIFNPSVEEMYPPGTAETVIDFPSLTTILEGRHRPGHFRGVCLVVAKLFNIFAPEAALFGRKDFQQLRVISAMAQSLNFPTEVVGCPTVREADGLAMSSRNQYLSAEDRKRALALSRGLFTAAEQLKAGYRQANRLTTTMQRILLEQHVLLDYVAAVDPITLKEIDVIEGPTVLAVAARVGNTRLIDNITVTP
jgi:pantoate--beta-alanine ligase